jgi:OTU domain-containing protein 3
MRENPDNFKPFIHVDQGRRRNPKRKNTGAYQSSTEDVTEEQIEVAWKEYLLNMGQDGTYGDNQEIRAFTKAYNTDVEVYQKTKEVYCFRALDGEDSAVRPTAYIAYHVRVFKKLIPISYRSEALNS